MTDKGKDLKSNITFGSFYFDATLKKTEKSNIVRKIHEV